MLILLSDLRKSSWFSEKAILFIFIDVSRLLLDEFSSSESSKLDALKSSIGLVLVSWLSIMNICWLSWPADLCCCLVVFLWLLLSLASGSCWMVGCSMSYSKSLRPEIASIRSGHICWRNTLRPNMMRSSLMNVYSNNLVNLNFSSLLLAAKSIPLNLKLLEYDGEDGIFAVFLSDRKNRISEKYARTEKAKLKRILSKKSFWKQEFLLILNSNWTVGFSIRVVIKCSSNYYIKILIYLVLLPLHFFA